MIWWSLSCRCDVAEVQFRKQCVGHQAGVRPTARLMVGSDGRVQLIARQTRAVIVR